MTAIEIENLSKQYALGKIGTSTLARDLNVWWARMRGKPNPYLKIGQTNDRSQKADGDFVWALKDINFKVEEGDVVGIIGKNGAGKSTLLKILSRITTPTTGRVTTYGRVASLLEVGTGFHGEMTGRENIYMNGSIMGMTRAEISRKLDEIVDFAGVEKYIDTPVKRYSSGMTVRLGFAVAAFLEPEILIVDEVLAVGDAEFQKKAIGKMQDVSRGQGRTVLFVSHNMNAIKKLCRSGMVLDKGQVVYFGSAYKCVQYYQDNDLCELIGHSFVDDSMREKGHTGEITIEEARLLNDIYVVGSDEPLELELTLRKHFGSAQQCRYSVNIFDFSDTRILGYVTQNLNIPQQQDSYKVYIKLSNHSLTARKYKLSLNVGYKDFGGDVRNFDVVNSGVLSFEVKYVNRQKAIEYLNWNPEWGAIIHQGILSEVKLV